MFIKKSFALLAFLSFSMCLYAQESIVVLSTKTGKIEGTLSFPLSKTNAPLVIFVSGSGPTDRDGNQPKMKNNSLKYLADELARVGIASLRYDKRGVGASAKAMIKENDLRFETYVSDLSNWIKRMSLDKRFTEFYLLGHSEGALIATLATLQNKEVKGLISVSGPAVSADKLLKKQLESQPELVKKKIFPMIDKLKRGEPIEDVPFMLNAFFRQSVQPYLISWFKYEPSIEIAKLGLPILILHGDSDIQVLPDQAKRLAAANKNAELKIVSGMNHVLKDCILKEAKAQGKVYNDPKLLNSKELSPSVAQFIRKHQSNK